MTFEEKLKQCQRDIAFAGEHAATHRGQGRKLASLIEMLAITQWQVIETLLTELRKTDDET